MRGFHEVVNVIIRAQEDVTLSHSSSLTASHFTVATHSCALITLISIETSQESGEWGNDQQVIANVSRPGVDKVKPKEWFKYSI